MLLISTLLLGCLAGIIKGIVGFALPMILITGLSNIMSLENALACLILPTVVTNFIQAFTSSSSTFLMTLKKYKVFLFFSGFFLILSSQLFFIVPSEFLLGIIGIIIISYSISQLLGYELSFKNNIFFITIIGSINGFIGGISGIWGPLTVSYLTSLNIRKNEQIKIQGIIYSLGSILLLVCHLKSGIFNLYSGSLSLALVPFSIIGLIIGSKIRDKIKQNTFRKFTLFMILLASINLVRKAFF